MSEALGRAELELGADLKPLDRDLARAERRVAASAAAMQATLDGVHADVALDVQQLGALIDRNARAMAQAGGPSSTMRETVVEKPTTAGGRQELWGARGPQHPGSITNPMVVVLEAAKRTPMGSYAANIGVGDQADAQRGDSSSGVATAASMAAVAAAVSDLSSRLGPGSLLAQAAGGRLAESAPAAPTPSVVSLSERDSQSLRDTAAALRDIAGSRSASSSGPSNTELAAAIAALKSAHTGSPSPSRVIVAGSGGSRQTVLAGPRGDSTVRLDGAQYVGLLSAMRQSRTVPVLVSGGGGGGGGGGMPPAAVAPGGGGGDRGGTGWNPLTGFYHYGGRGGGGNDRGILSRLGWGGGVMGAAGVGSALSFGGLGFEHAITTLLGLLGSAGAGAAGGGLLAAGSIGKLAVGGGSDLAVMGSTIKQTQSLSQAVDKLDKAQSLAQQSGAHYQAVVKEYGKNSQQAKQALSEYHSAVRSATTAQMDLNQQVGELGNTAGVKAELGLAKATQALKDFWNAQTSTARVQAVKILMQTVQLGHDFVPLVAQAAARNLAIINDSIKPLFTWLEGPQGIGIFQNLENRFAHDLPTAVHAGSQALELLLRVIDLASRDTGGFIAYLDRLFTRLNSMDNMTLGAVIDRLVGDFRLWEHFIKLLIADIYQLFHQDVGTANSIVGALTAMLQKLHDWETSTRGKAQIQNIFEVHKTQILLLIQALAGLGKAFGGIYLAVAPAMVGALNAILKVITPVIGAVASLASHSHLLALALGGLLISAKAFGAGATLNALKSFFAWFTGAETANAAAANLDAAAQARVAAAAAAAGAGGAGGAAAGAAGGGARGLPALLRWLAGTGSAAGGGAALTGLPALLRKAGTGVEAGGLKIGGALEAAGAGGLGMAVVNAAIKLAPIAAKLGSILSTALFAAARTAVPALADYIAVKVGEAVGNAIVPSSHSGPRGYTQSALARTLGPTAGFSSRGLFGTGIGPNVDPLRFLGLGGRSPNVSREVSDFGLQLAKLKTPAKLSADEIDKLKQRATQLAREFPKAAGGLNAVWHALDRLTQTSGTTAHWQVTFNDAWRAVNRFYLNSKRDLGSLKDDFSTILRRINTDVGLNSAVGLRLWRTAIDKMVTATTQGMLNNKIKVSQGLKEINQDIQQGIQAGAITWQHGLAQMFDTTLTLYKHHKIDTKTFLSELNTITSNGWKDINASVHHRLQDQLGDLKTAFDKGQLTHKQYLKAVHDDQVAANKQSVKDMGQFAQSILDGMIHAGTASAAGVKAIMKPLLAALKAMGASAATISTVSILASINPSQAGNLVTQAAAGVSPGGIASPHAGGGLIQIGQPGQAGRDSVPMNVGGQDITVAPGEKVAVLNRHQAPLVDRAVQMAYGVPGLAGLFQAVRTPNYMADGGYVPGYAGGGVAFSGLTSTFGPPTERAGGTAFGRSSADPGLSLRIPGTSFGDARNRALMGHVFRVVIGGHSGNLMDIDLGPAEWTKREIDVTGAGARAIGINPFAFPTDSVGSVTELDAGAVTSLGGAIGAALTQINAPKVSGKGVLADIVRGGLKMVADAANKYEAAHAPVGGAGGFGAVSSGFGGHSGYVFPFPKGTSYSWQRIDQGQDLEATPGSPIVAIAPGSVTTASDRFGGFGPFYPTEQISSGPLAGRGVYYGHTKTLKTGQVAAGDVIGVTQSHADTWTAAPAGWLELGFLPYGSMSAGNAIAPILHAIASGQYAGGGFVPSLAGGGLLEHFATGGSPRAHAAYKPTAGKKKPQKPKHKKPAPKGKLPQLKPIPGFDATRLSQIDAVGLDVQRLQGWQSYLGGLHQRVPVQPIVTLTNADGSTTDVVNSGADPAHTFHTDPGSGAEIITIAQRLAQIGQPGSLDPNTEMGIEDLILGDYIKQQALAGQISADFTPWLAHETKDAAKWQNWVNIDQQKLDYLTHALDPLMPIDGMQAKGKLPPEMQGWLKKIDRWVRDLKNQQARELRAKARKEHLPLEKADRNAAINARFARLRARVQASAATASFDGTELLSQQDTILSSEERKALGAIPAGKPAHWHGDAASWRQQRGEEIAAIHTEFQERRDAIHQSADRHNFSGRLHKQQALLALRLEEGADRLAVEHLFGNQRLSLSDTETRAKAAAATDTHRLKDEKAYIKAKLNAATKNSDAWFLAQDQKAISDALGTDSGTNIKDTLAAYLDPMGALAINIDSARNIDIPNLLDEISKLTGTSVTNAAAGTGADTGTGTAGADNSALTALLDQRNQELASELAVSQAQYKVLASLPTFAGIFHQGGVVPGPPGLEQLALVQGGEGIVTRQDMAAPGSVVENHLHISGKDGWLKDLIRVEAKQIVRDVGRNASRRLPSQGGGHFVGAA